MRPLHLCALKDNLRPTLQYIQVFRNRVIATNGHILIVLPVSEVFGEEIIKESEELYFNAEDWKKSKFHKATEVAREGNTFTGLVGKSNAQITALTSKQFTEKTNGGRFPRYEVAFPVDIERIPLQNLAIHPESLTSLAKCFGANFIELRFTKGNLGVVVTNPGSKGIGLVMPSYSDFNSIDIEHRLGVSKENWEELL